MHDIPVGDLIARMEKRDWVALSRAISLVENDTGGRAELLNYAYRASREDCLLLGITGTGGAGKSTLIDGVLQVYSGMGKRVGVLAVDPSSSYTGGAVLGDRIRMGRHGSDQNIFIRSFGSRGALGGISRGVKDALYLYKSFGFDVILVESLGVGQAETDITSFVDVTTVVMAPGSGDYIQLAKAGTQEIADIFVVNKADSPEADVLYRQLAASFELLPQGMRPFLLKTIARDEKGIPQLVDLFQRAGEKLLPNRGTKKRVRLINEIEANAVGIFQPALREAVEAMVDDVLAGRLTPCDAAARLGRRIALRP